MILPWSKGCRQLDGQQLTGPCLTFAFEVQERLLLALSKDAVTSSSRKCDVSHIKMCKLFILTDRRGFWAVGSLCTIA
jgi:hypothetical protein